MYLVVLVNLVFLLSALEATILRLFKIERFKSKYNSCDSLYVITASILWNLEEVTRNFKGTLISHDIYIMLYSIQKLDKSIYGIHHVNMELNIIIRTSDIKLVTNIEVKFL